MNYFKPLVPVFLAVSSLLSVQFLQLFSIFVFLAFPNTLIDCYVSKVIEL